MSVGWAAAAQAGSEILGGLMTQASNERVAADNRIAAEKAQEKSDAMQKEFAQHGIRWKVEDAKAAGLHPLFALGGATTSYSPTAYVGDGGRQTDGLGQALTRAGQHIGRAVSAQETSEQREQRLMGLQVQASQVRENDARALYYENEAAKTAQSNRQATAFPVSAPTVVPSQWIKPKPDEVISARAGDASVTAGVHPGIREYNLSRHGLRIRLPYSEEGPSESLENIPWYMWPGMIQHNRSFYGSDWGTRFLKEFVFDQSPKYRSRGVDSGSMAVPKRGKSQFNRSIMWR